MRLRIHFSKTEAMRYTGHLDLHRSWERTFRRARLPLAYSQGFHPQPRINLACALPLGFTSQAELVDVWLEETLPLDNIQAVLDEAVPPGVKIHAITCADLKLPSLQSQVMSAEYEIQFLEETPDLLPRVQALLEASSLPRERREKPYDLRSLIEKIVILPADTPGAGRLQICMKAQAGATGRPEELIAALGYDPSTARVHRTRINLQE